MSEDNEIRWGLAQRFEFIEWRVYWTGRLNRKDLEDEFQISTPQASADLKRYQEEAPGNIGYDATEKCYISAATDFRPKFLKLSPERYLLQLQALTSGAIEKRDTWFNQPPPNSVIPTILRVPEAYTLHAILRAIEQRAAISINYRSLTRAGVRIICPHALAHDGYRWHVRALSTDHGEFRDYVLGRILSVSPPQPADVDPDDDLEWTTEGTLELTPHPALDERQQQAIEHDYKMKDGQLAVRMKLALAYYFIKRNNLDLRGGEIRPERAQIFLRNFDEITMACAEAKARSKEKLAARLSKKSSA